MIIQILEHPILGHHGFVLRSRACADRLKGKVEEVRKEVSVSPKIRIEGGRSGNRIEHVELNNDS